MPNCTITSQEVKLHSLKTTFSGTELSCSGSSFPFTFLKLLFYLFAPRPHRCTVSHSLATSALQLLSLHPYISHTISPRLTAFTVGIPYPKILHVKSSKFFSATLVLLPVLLYWRISEKLYYIISLVFPCLLFSLILSVLSTLCVKDPSREVCHQVIFTAQVFATLPYRHLVLFGRPGDI